MHSLVEGVDEKGTGRDILEAPEIGWDDSKVWEYRQTGHLERRYRRPQNASGMTEVMGKVSCAPAVTPFTKTGAVKSM